MLMQRAMSMPPIAGKRKMMHWHASYLAAESCRTDVALIGCSTALCRGLRYELSPPVAEFPKASQEAPRPTQTSQISSLC